MKKALLLLFLVVLNKLLFGQFSNRLVIDSTANGITEIITVDIDNDSLKDIIVSQKFLSNNKISYYKNIGNGLFNSQEILISNINSPVSLTSGDFNNDGWKDIASISQLDDKVFIFTNNNGMTFSQQIIDISLFHPVDIKVTDIDNDNDDDVVVIGDTNLVVYYNDGIGNFIKTNIPSGINTEYYDLAVSDIDGDGFKDLIIGGVKTLVYKNSNGTINFDALRTNSINNIGLVILVDLNDINNDGHQDLVIGGNNITDLRWYSNDGNGFFNFEQVIENNAIQCQSVCLQDFNNDGFIDLFTALPQSGKIVWYKNNGDNTFDVQNLIYQGIIPFTKEVVSDDMNNDTFFDIIWAEELSIHLNSLSLSVNEQVINSYFQLYPNPATTEITIKSNYSGKLDIYDYLGKIIYNDIIITKGENIIDLNLTPLTYIFHIKTNKKNIYKKIIIN